MGDTLYKLTSQKFEDPCEWHDWREGGGAVWCGTRAAAAAACVGVGVREEGAVLLKAAAAAAWGEGGVRCGRRAAAAAAGTLAGTARQRGLLLCGVVLSNL